MADSSTTKSTWVPGSRPDDALGGDSSNMTTNSSTTTTPYLSSPPPRRPPPPTPPTSTTTSTNSSNTKDDETHKTKKKEKGEKGKKEKEKPEKVKKEKEEKGGEKKVKKEKGNELGDDSGTEAPKDLVDAIERGRDQIAVDLQNGAWLNFLKTEKYEKSKKPIDHYLFDRKSKEHKHFRAFCVKPAGCENILDCLDEFSKILEMRNNYTTFMNLFHTTCETFLTNKEKKEVFFPPVLKDKLLKAHDKYWDEKAGMPRDLPKDKN